MPYKEFLNSTPRQIKGLNILNERYKRNIILEALTIINGPATKVVEKKNVEKVSSFSDLF